MKINKHHPQFKAFLNHYPPLVNGFLSTLISSKEELQAIIDPPRIISQDDCLDQFHQIIRSHQRLLICGDFDADGILSTTMLFRLFKSINKEVGYYIPNRLTEGYGTSLKTVMAAHQKGYDCIIMVDNGVVNGEAHHYCHEHDLTLVVIDHHQIPQPVLCDCLIHPDVMDDYYQSLCSCGLVYTFAQKFDLNDELNTIFAGIGTIGDMMPLRKQNRYITTQALQRLNTNRVPVIDKLLKKPVDYWDAQTIAFQIVPVFNALGRLADLGNVNTIVQYLSSHNPVVIEQFSSDLKQINQQRKNLSAAQGQMALRLANEDELFQIIHNPQFHPGIVGIIAGQLSNSLDKPTMILSGEGLLKGSVRSNQLDVYQFLSQFKEDYFESFGGHASACALSIKQDKYPQFKLEVNKRIQSVQLSQPSMDVLEFDPIHLRKEAFEILKDFEPFGQGFKPMDLMIEARVVDVRRLGQAGYLLTILPVGDIKEILYFKQDLAIENTSFVLKAIGSLQLNYRQELSFIAKYLMVDDQTDMV